MMPQDWESPGRLDAAGGGAVYGGAEPAAAYGLRPLSTGEVLDRTFAIYRAHFWLFAGLASLAGAFSLVLNAIQLVVHHMVLLQHGIRIAGLVTQIAGGVIAILVLPVEAVVYAASVYALCEVYLGRRTTAKEAVQATIGRWLRYVGIALWQGWSAVWAGADRGGAGSGGDGDWRAQRGGDGGAGRVSVVCGMWRAAGCMA